MNTTELVVREFMENYVINQLLQKEMSEKIDINSFMFSEGYHKFLVRSMQSLGFEKWEIEDFEKEFPKYQESFNQFFASKESETTARLFSKVTRCCENMEFWEHKVKEAFTKNWSKNLTQAVSGTYQKFAILVQALQISDFCNPGRGQLIGCSLFTDKLQDLYYNRHLGYVYDLKDRDIIFTSTSDAQSSFYNPLDFKAEPNRGKIIGSAFGHVYLHNQAFWSFNDFTNKCKQGQLNEIGFYRTTWEGQCPSGVFLRDGAGEKERYVARLTSDLRGIPIYEYKNGNLIIY